MSSAAIAGRMSEVGWKAERLQAWPTGVKFSDRKGHVPVSMELYVIPVDWEHGT